jgi:voltage-gated sodium channel
MTAAVLAAEPGHRARLGALVEHPRFNALITALIVINAVTLGLETSARAMAVAGGLLTTLDRSILAVFVIELLLRLYAHGLRFFRGGWNWFDLVVVGIALVPATGGLSVLRALRILRVLRLISVVPQMRMVIESVARSLPGLGSIALLLLIFFYVFAVLATKLFGAEYPLWFGHIGASLFSLFQVMTLESWTTIARGVMQTQPWAWLFFLTFILFATFTVLNLFIAVIVNAMQEQHEAQVRAGTAAPTQAERLELEVRGLRAELAELRSLLARAGGNPGSPGA